MEEMTIEAAVRQELREAYLQEIQLFAEYTNSLSNKEASQLERQHRLSIFRDAVKRKVSIQRILHGVLEGERIRQDRLRSLGPNLAIGV